VTAGNTAPAPGAQGTQDAARLADGWTPRLVFRMVLLLLTSEVGFLVFAYPLNVLPQIGATFHTTQVAWMQTIYALVAAVTAGITGKVADRYGKRAVVLAVIGIVLIGSLVCAFAPNFAVMLVGRALQAPALALTFLLPSLVRDIFPSRTIPLAVTLSTAGSGAISIACTYLIGTIVTNLGFRAMFWLPAIFCGLVLVLAATLVPESPVRSARESLDSVGAVLLGIGVGGVLLGVSLGPTWGWGSPKTLIAVAAGVALLIGWVIRSLRVAFPMIDLRELADLRLTVALVFGAIGIALVTWYYVLMPLVALTPGAGWGLGLSPDGESNIAALYTAGGFVAGFLVGRSLARFRTASVGICSMIAIALGYLIATAGLTNSVVFGIATFVIGGCSAAVYGVAYILVIETVTPERQATTSAIVTLGGNLFSAILPVVIYAIMNSLAKATATGLVYPASAIRTGELIPVGLAVVGLGCTLVLRLSRVSTKPEPAAWNG
jgi:MFS family permease